MRDDPKCIDTNSLTSRLNDAVDVSSAFHNCFFHAYAAYLLANNLPMPTGLFQFKSLLGPQSAASQLQVLFKNKASLDLFAQYEKLTHRQSTSSPHYIVEKSLILGCLLREWFATLWASNLKLRKTKFHESNIFSLFSHYSNNRLVMSKQDVLSQEVVLEANEAFLEYTLSRPKTSLSTEEEQFEDYFITTMNVRDAYTAYWEKEGHLRYCKFIAQLNTTISPADIIPILKEINQPTIIYDKNGTIITSFPLPTDKPKTFKRPPLELKLDHVAGHYYLLKSSKTAPLLEEYQKSYALYKNEREGIISLKNNPPITNTNEQFDLAHTEQTLLVGAICPAHHITWDPFTFLIQKTHAMNDELLLYKPDYSFLLKAGAAFCTLGSLASSVISALAMAAIISLSTTGIGLAVGLSIATGLTAYGLFKIAQSQRQSPTASPGVSPYF